MQNLTGNDIPIPGNSYIIHTYPIQEGPFEEYVNAVTVDLGPNVPGTVTMAEWDGRPSQKFECVENGGYLGFICRAAPASYHGAYLGYNAYEILICEAQYQQKWEDMVVIKRIDGGFEWCMRKDDHLGYISRNHSYPKLIMLKDFTEAWGFTKWYI
ncbi:hypothetical protein AB204_20375 [Xenorhabdus khoisanae]|uniref:Uncharacterized protein n=1 Tax=Xenorhabdus khoisanae TaxID=880157 RepID=A0A0J5IJG5_9GAMM|nr:hypothetical protein [Xenorhabdus khoisanae]KMJ43315.1 hypothetical protein AB204_20375 [Xenorhabdus khoisanae]